jgi:hypothetical protein
MDDTAFLNALYIPAIAMTTHIISCLLLCDVTSQQPTRLSTKQDRKELLLLPLQLISSSHETKFTTKVAVFWVVAPCSLAEVGKLLPDYTALQPRRQPSSYAPP